MEHNTLSRARTYEAQHRTPRRIPPPLPRCPAGGLVQRPQRLVLLRRPVSSVLPVLPLRYRLGTHALGPHRDHRLPALAGPSLRHAPDAPFDANGCFSGGAIEWQGRQLLLYTGVMPEGGKKEIQQQCLAIGDGVDYHKADAPVITCDEQPAGASRKDFRDPFLFKQDGMLYMLLGGRGFNGHGRLLLYRNARPDDPKAKWEFVQVLAENDGSLGSMWECPGLFTLEGKTVLVISPQFVHQAADDRYHCGNDTAAIIGRWGGPAPPFVRQADQPLDSGLDFYAPQTMQTPDGRRVLIGWMQNWDHCYPPEDAPWYGQMSLPRELFWQGDTLCQRPVRELDAVRRLRTEHRGVEVDSQPVALEGVAGRVLDCELTVDVTEAPAVRRAVCLRPGPLGGTAAGPGRRAAAAGPPPCGGLPGRAGTAGNPAAGPGGRHAAAADAAGPLLGGVLPPGRSAGCQHDALQRGAGGRRHHLLCRGKARMDLRLYDLAL